MNAVDSIHWRQRNLTTKEKMFLIDFVSTYAGLINVQTVTRIYDRKRNAYFLRFQSAHDLDLTDTFSCFNVEEHKTTREGLIKI